MMSSFHDVSGLTPVENLNNSNICRVMSPVALLNKSDFTTPKMLTEVELTTPVHIDKDSDNDRNIAPSVNNDSEVSIDPVRLEIHEFNCAEAFPALLSTSNQIEVVMDPGLATISSSTGSANESQSNHEDESFRFALQLQYQEEEELIQMQLANLRAVVVAGGLSGDDISTMQLMMSDLQHQLQYVRASAAALNAPTQETTEHTGGNEGEERSFVDSQAGDEEQEEVEGNEAEEEEEEEQWDYEQLLQLGQRLGDVKTERWRMRAQSVIDTLPVLSFGELRRRQHGIVSVMDTAAAVVVDLVDDADILNLLNDSNSSVLGKTSAKMTTKVSGNGQSIKKAKLSHDSHEIESVMTPAEKSTQKNEMLKEQEDEEEEHCIVCMEPYVPEDIVRQLPCKHFFHCHCTQGWLVDHNSCPYCKTKVTATP